MKAPMPLLLRGDARALPLPDNSVDLIVTSPPYFGLRSYTDGGEHYDGQVGSEATPTEFLDALIACTTEMVRVLKPTGSLFVNLGDCYASRSEGFRRGERDGVHQPYVRPRTGVTPKCLFGIPWRYAIRCVDELGLVLRQELIWSKPNGLPEPVTDRCRRSHEQWFHFATQRHYYSAVDEIREPHQRSWTPGKTGGHTYQAMKVPGEKDSNLATSAPNPLGKLPGSVWEIATQPLKAPAHLGVDHFAAFPMEWPRRLILGWSPPGGTVLDPFSGTGTTALVAAMLGRTGIGVDMSADYNRLARWRAGDPKERARAAGLDPDQVATLKPEIEGQVDMFDLLKGDVA